MVGLFPRRFMVGSKCDADKSALALASRAATPRSRGSCARRPGSRARGRNAAARSAAWPGEAAAVEERIRSR